MHRFKTSLRMLAVLALLAGCDLVRQPPPPEPAKAPDEMPAPDPVPAGRVTSEPLRPPPGVRYNPGSGDTAQRPRGGTRTVLATTAPPPATPLRLRELTPLTRSEIGRMMVGNYYQQRGGRVLHLRPDGNAVIVRRGTEPMIQAWSITNDDRLCLTSGTILTCQYVYRVGEELLLAAEDGNQRAYYRLEGAPAWF